MSPNGYFGSHKAARSEKDGNASRLPGPDLETIWLGTCPSSLRFYTPPSMTSSRYRDTGRVIVTGSRSRVSRRTLRLPESFSGALRPRVWASILDVDLPGPVS
ncbi:MAG: hypothetical protein QOD46_872 [Actinomycetota bacterium]|nr:hypothetical protein [Actinomycetota bacterium]